MTSIVIPDSVTNIGNSAFQNCPAKLRCTFNGQAAKAITNSGASYCLLDNDLLYFKGQSISGCDSSAVSVTIPDGVTGIGSRAFLNCRSLTSIIIPSGVTSIGDYAFDGCSNLTGIVIPDGVTNIGRRAFCGCLSLLSIAIPDSVTNIGNSAFTNCSYLTSIVIPDSVTCISDSAFNGCSSLTSIVIPNSVTDIGESAFHGCSSLTSIVIPNSVTSIDDWAFCYCRSLTSIVIPNTVTSINEYVFKDCSSLTNIYCYEFSYAAKWANDNGMSSKICYLDGVTEPVSISLPKDIYIARGSEKVLQPIAIPSGSYSYRWTSSDPNIVSVSDVGVLTGVSTGYATINASYGECTATANVYCYAEYETLAFTEPEVWIIAQKTHPLRIDFRPEGAFEPIRYASYNTTIASVGADGLITAKSVGEVTITATSLITGKTASALAHVCYPAQTVEFVETEITVKPCATAQATANAIARNGTVYENRFVTYASADPAIATVSESGMVTGVSEGTTTITATIENGASASCTVIVTEHEHTIIEVEAAEPTCTEDGHTAGTKCAVCGKTLSGMEPIPASGHSVVEDAAIPATCTEAGRAAGTHCAVCNTVLSGGEEIPATGHIEIEVEEKPATCYAIGTTAGKKCSVCEAVLSGCEEIPMIDHMIVNDAYIAPTLTTAGCTAGSHCEICGTILEAQRVIPALTDAPIIAIPKAVAEIAEETYINTAVEVVRLPDTCTKINSRAFANCAKLRIIEIPASSVDIADDAFVDSPNVVIVTHEGSAAQQYARAHDIPYLTYPAK